MSPHLDYPQPILRIGTGVPLAFSGRMAEKLLEVPQELVRTALDLKLQEARSFPTGSLNDEPSACRVPAIRDALMIARAKLKVILSVLAPRLREAASRLLARNPIQRRCRLRTLVVHCVQRTPVHSGRGSLIWLGRTMHDAQIALAVIAVAIFSSLVWIVLRGA